MKHLLSLPSMLAALCLAVPATGLSGDRHQDRCDWHGHFRGPHGHFYGGWLPPLPFIGPWAYPYPYYGYGPAVGVTVAPDAGPTYRGGRVDEQADSLAAEVQRALQHDGYYRGDIDGDIGTGTRAAIRQYQYDQHLEVTGRIDRALLRSLGMD